MNADKAKVNAFLKDMGFDPNEVKCVEINPWVMWVTIYKKNNEGKIYMDSRGDVATRTEKVLLADFAETVNGG